MSFQYVIRVFIAFFLVFYLYGPRLLQAQVEVISIDFQESKKILKTTVPFEPEVLLSLEDLPKQSHQHPGVMVDHQKFTHMTLSPNRKALAFSVAGERHSWTGVYHLDDQQLNELALVFEGTAGIPYWSDNGRYLAVEEGSGHKVRYLEIFDLIEKSQCRLNGKDLKNKFYNLTQPWWSPEESQVFFKVEYNNFYRKALGLKAKKLASRIGSADPNCNKTALFSVKEFMGKFPQMAGSDRVSFSGGDEEL